VAPADHLPPGSTDDLVRDLLAGALAEPRDWPPGWSVNHVDVTGSTNTDLLAAAPAGAPDRTVLRAGHQTAGRGRLDRRWDAPPGTNLLVSLLFRSGPTDPGELVHRVGLAVVDATRALGGPAVVGLKWPNDVVVDDAKLVGILAQRATDGSVVVGFGCNVAWAPEGATRLHDLLPHDGGTVTPPVVLAAVLAAFDRLPVDADELHARYQRELTTLGRRVRVELPAGEIVGTAVGVDPDGRLVVLDECAISHRVDVGDVVHLRPV
jgi:BirA family biotin operon repressor/biotin-[acetyl-CoA-carboxylase] ligase